MLVTKPNEKDPKLKSIEILGGFHAIFCSLLVNPFHIKRKKIISLSYWVIYLLLVMLKKL